MMIALLQLKDKASKFVRTIEKEKEESGQYTLVFFFCCFLSVEVFFPLFFGFSLAFSPQLSYIRCSLFSSFFYPQHMHAHKYALTASLSYISPFVKHDDDEKLDRTDNNASVNRQIKLYCENCIHNSILNVFFSGAMIG